MNIVLLGPPGAGKGSLAQLLKEEHSLLHISTGDLLREEMKKESDLGKQAKSYVEKGELVPDELVTQLLANKLKTAPKQAGYLLDGYPRTRAQAESLDALLKEIERPVQLALYLDCDLDLIIRRITGRRVAPKSGRVYHIVNRPPKREGFCDESGEPLIQRPDDNEETVRKRMAVYLENTLPIVQYYEDQGILRKMDGAKESEDLQQELVELIDEQARLN